MCAPTHEQLRSDLHAAQLDVGHAAARLVQAVARRDDAQRGLDAHGHAPDTL